LKLKELEYLDLSGNDISDMRGGEELINLRILYIGNRVSEINGKENY